MQFIAQLERDLIRERANAGLDAARARGRRGGRPAKLDAKQVAEIRRLYDSRTVTVNQIAAMMGVGRATVYRALKPQINGWVFPLRCGACLWNPPVNSST